MKHSLCTIRTITSLCLFISLCVAISAQSTIISPSGDGGFENGATFAANGWSSDNGSVANQWFLGNVSSVPAGVLSGSRAAYISADAGLTNAYNNTSVSIVHFWKDITIPAGETNITLSFNCAVQGEAAANDALMVSVAPVSYTPVASSVSIGTAGLAAPANTINQRWNLGVAQTVSFKIPASLTNNCQNDAVLRLIFTWKNNHTDGTAPAVSIDNISLIAEALTPLSGVYSVGPTGTYPNLSEAVSDVNSLGAGGPVVLELQSNYTSTSENFPIVLSGQANCFPLNSTNTVTIRPAAGAGAISVSANNTTGPAIDINSGQWWIINGLNSGGTSLTIENTAVGSVSTVRFINDASNNVVSNCELKGAASASGNNGVVLFSTGTSNGNDNNTVSDCRIGPAGTNYPVNGIISAGNAMADNSSNTVSNCEIFDYFSSSLPSCGINLTAAGNSAWTINGNRFYLKSAFTYSNANIHRAIFIGTGKAYNINANSIGGSTSDGSGIYTMQGAVATRFVGIDVTTVAGQPSTNINANAVYNVSLATSSATITGSGILCGISISGFGDYNMGTTTGNIVGSATGTGSLFASSTSRGAVVGIHSASTGSVLISNNQIGACTSVGSSANVAGVATGINVTASATSLTVNNNTVGSTVPDNMRAGVNGSTTGSSCVSGIYINANPLVASITGNTIRNLSSFGIGNAGYVRGIWTISNTSSNSTGWYISDNIIDNLKTNAVTSGLGTTNPCSVVGIHHAASLGCTISGNSISNLSNISSSSVGTMVGGIALLATAQSTVLLTEISRNKIWGLSNSTTSSNLPAPSAVFGIGIRSGNGTLLVSNNMVSLGSAQSTNTTITGIWSNNSASPDPVATNIYNNSVVIDGTVATGALPTFAYLRGDLSTTPRTPVVDLKNNIFENRRTGGSGQHFAIANNYGLPAVSNGWPTNASDFNILYSASTSTLGFWTIAQTFSGWKAASSGDNNTQNVSANFSDVSSGDLHISAQPNSPAEGNGTPIASVITDYDNQTRSTLSAIDIGADAGNFASYPTVSFTLQPNTCSTSTLSLVATISDQDGVPTSGTGLPVLYWKKNSGSYSPATATYISGSQYSFTFGGNVTSGDIISYYFATQDNAGNAGITPGFGASGLALSPPTVATPPVSPFTFLITQTLSGNYTVGTGGNFPTLTAAVNAYNSLCLSGPVVFSLTDASYPSETFPIVINSNTDANASNTLTIKPASAAVSISGSVSNGAILKLNGADYVTIDGSINGDNNKSLTITNTAATAPVGIWLSNSGNGATRNTVKNCIVNTNAATVATACGIAVSGSTVFAAGADNDFNSIRNNSITSTNIGLYVNGTSTDLIGAADNLLVAGNKFYSVSSSTLVPVIGMQIGNTRDAAVSQNSISLLCAAATQPVGISLESGFSNSSVTRNDVAQVATTNTNGYGGRGITVAPGNSSSNITIANNQITGVNGSNYSSFGNSSSMGIAIGVAGNSSNLNAVAGGINVYNNSINMHGSYSYNANCITTALYIGANSNTLDIRNNLLVNSMNNTNSSGGASKNYALYCAASNAAFSNVDFNNYSVTGSQGVLGFLGTDVSSIPVLRNTTGQDANSLSSPPSFISNTDLHLTASGNDCMDMRGTPVASLSADYDGETRNSSTPDIGMDEFTSNANFNIQVSENSGLTSNDGVVCSGAPVTLSVSNGLSYSWSTGAGTSSIVALPITSTTYSVTINLNGCSVLAEYTINTTPLPSPSVAFSESSGINNDDGTICAGSVATLTATGGSAWLWSTGSSSSAISVNPSVTTSYTVTITNSSLCSATTSALITINPFPTTLTVTENSGAVVNDRVICEGASATLTAPPGTSYLWNMGSTETTITVAPTVSTSYSVSFISVDNCPGTVETSLIVNALPLAMVSVAESSGLSNDDGIICVGSAVLLNASGGESYLWSTGDGIDLIEVNPSDTTTYMVTVTNANSCFSVDEVTIIVNQPFSAVDYTESSGLTNDDGVICDGATAGLTASGGVSFLWSTGDINASVFVSPSESETYYVTVTDENGCISFNQASVTVDELPVPIILFSEISGVSVNDGVICNGDLVTISVNGGVSYEWNNGAFSSEIYESPSNTTTYSVTATDINACSQSTSAIVVVAALPTPTISPSEVSGLTNNDGTICLGANVSLHAGTHSAYLWNNGSTTSSISVSPSSTSTYSVTVTSPAGCSSTTEKTVFVNALPVASISGVTTICNGNSTVLTAAGGVLYAWSGSLGTNSGVTLSPSATTGYTVTVTDVNGCTDTETATVTVNALPVASISGVTTICNGDSTLLTAAGGVSYAWSGSLGTNSGVTLSPSATTGYTVTVTDVNGCTDTETATVTVNALPVANISGVTTICNGNSTVLTAAGGVSYAWSGSLGTNSGVTLSPSTTTGYTVTVTDINGCTDTETATVTVNVLPVATISGVTTICNGNSTVLTAAGGVSYAWSGSLGTNSGVTLSPSTTTGYTVTVTDVNGCTDTETATVTVNALPVASISGVTTICNGNSTVLTAAGGVSYAWSGSLGTNSGVTLSPSTTTGYTVTVTDINGCTDTETATVTVNALPVASISGVTTICNGNSTVLTAAGGVSYAWSGSLGTNSGVTLSPSTTTGYTVTVTDVNGCTDTETATVTVNALPVASISGVTTICNGNSTLLTAAGGVSYAWSGSLGTNSGVTLSPSATTGYTVTVTDINGCTDTETATVTVNALPVASISGVTTICNGNSTVLTAAGGVSYAWSGSLGTNSGVTLSPSTTTGYTVTVTDVNGCTDTETATVTVNALPVASISGVTTICNGNSTVLTAAGGVSYAWSGSLGTNSGVTLSPSTTTGYTVTVTDVNGCTDTETATVTVNALPVATISGVTTICNGNSTVLTAAGGVLYAWSGSLGTNSGVTLSPSTTTGYTVTVTDINGCTDTETATVTVNALPVASISGVTTICNGNSTVLTAAGGVSYAWSGSLGTNSGVTLSPSTTTGYTVTVTDVNGCTDTETATVTVNALPVASISGVTTICNGNSTVLTAAGGVSYAWSGSLGTNSGVTLSPSTTTGYTVTVTDINGCTDTETATVTVNALPVASISGVTTICNGNSTVLTAAGGVSYAWSGSLGTNSGVTLSPSATTGYTVTVTDVNGCTDTETATVTVNALPVASISGVTTICNGNSTVLTAAGGVSYAWSGSLGTNSGVTLSPSATTGYTVTVTDVNGCTDTETATVTVNALPVASISGVTTICNGNSTLLTAAGGVSYAWSGSLGTNSGVTLSPSATTGYTVTVTDINGCTDTETATVTVNALPVATISGVTTICNGNSTVLTAAGGVSYAWSGSLGTNSGVTLSPSATTGYTVTVTDINGCTDTETATVTVNALPVATISGVTTICNGNSTVLTAAGGVLYAWSGSLGTNSGVTLSPSATTGYTVTVTDVNGCTDTETATVTVNALPVASISGVTTICNGNSTVLTAAGGVSYAWSGSLGTNSGVTLSPSATTGYTVTVTDINGCTDTETATVTVNALPVATISGVTTICNGNSTVLTAAGGVSYAWSGSLGTNSGVTLSPSTTTGYTVTVTDINGCTDTETATVTVNALPVASISGVTTICNGNSTVLTAAGGVSYAWSGSLGTNSGVTLSPSTTTGYTVTVTDINGCTDTETATVTVNALPVASISGVTTICNGNSTVLTAAGGVSYAWSGSLGTNSGVTLSPSTTTGYTVTVTDINGCTDTETATVTVNALPVASISGVTTICNGNSTLLTAAGGVSYAWSGSLGTNSGVTLSPSTTTGYTVTVTDINGCTDTETATVTVNALPVASISGVTTICNGNSTVLTAAGGVSYAWSGSLGTNSGVTLSPSATTGYTVTVTDINGCTDTETATVTVNALPVASISGVTTICNGNSTLLTAAGGVSYAWSGSLGTNSGVTLSPSATTGYTVTVTDINGCTDTETATVTVNALPVASISGVTTICNGNSTVLTAAGGVLYAWSGSLGTNSGVTLSPSTTTGYTVTVTDINGCTDTETATVTVNALPVASISGVTTICNGNSTVLTAAGGVSYAWSGSLGTNSGVTLSPSATTGYTVTVTDINGCTDTETATVTVNALPVATISGVTTICNGNSTLLTAAGGVSYAWSGSLGTNSGVTLSPSATTGYTVTVTDVNGCTDTETATVTVNALPVASISGVTTICNGNSTVLTAAGGVLYAWSGSLGTNSGVTLSPSTTTGYTVTVTDINGCTDTETATVTVNALPVASISGVTTICNGNSTVLTAAGGVSYAWSGSLGTNSGVTLSPSATTGYTVTVTDVNGCTDTETATVTVNALPVASISGVTTICNGNSTLLTAAGGVSYAWSGSLGTNSGVTLSPSATTGYTVTVTDINGCTDTETATVTVNALPVASISGVTTICNGNSTVLTAAGGVSYAWSGSLGTNSGVTLSPSTTTGYTVTVTDVNGCTDTETATVTVNALPVASISGVTTICNGSSTILSASAASSYVWSNGATTASVQVNPAVSTNYTVTVSNINSCTASASSLITVQGAPEITHVSPVTGSVGTVVTLTGNNFTNITQIMMNGVNCSVYTVWSPTQITVNIPFSGNILDVGINALCGNTSFITDRLIVTSINPLSGAPGTVIRIAGESMSDVNSVLIGGTPQLILDVAGDYIDIFVMPGTQTGVVTVSSTTETATSADIFTVKPTPVPQVQQGSKLVSTGATLSSLQGTSVAVSADGNTAIVGAPTDNNNVGGAWIFVRNGTTWIQQGGKLTGSGALGPAKQGYSVAISADGNTVAIGGPLDYLSSGAVWIFKRSGAVWLQQGSKLAGTGAAGYAQQGTSVSISADGNTVITGGIADDYYAGAVWVFKRSGNQWSQQGSKLTGIDISGKARFGCSLAISSDAKYLIAGGYNDNNKQGASWIFSLAGNMWQQQGNKLTGTLSSAIAFQGYAVAISAEGATALTGGPNDAVNNTGAAWVFSRSGSTWIQQGNKLLGSGWSNPSRQGGSVALSADGNTAVVAGFGDNAGAGAMWVFKRNATTWNQQGNKIVGTGASGTARQGSAAGISANGSTVVIGGPGDNTNRGAIWIFIPGTLLTPVETEVRASGHSAEVEKFVLYQNIPNPFTTRTIINFYIPEQCTVHWRITNANGMVVKNIERACEKGTNQEEFDMTGYSGIYWYTLETPFGVKTGKMMVLR